MRGIDADVVDGRVVYYLSLGVRWHRERQHRNNAGNAQECETIQYTRWEKSVFHSFLLMDIQIVYENEFFENDEEGYLFTRRGEPARMRVWHARALALRAPSGRRGL